MTPDECTQFDMFILLCSGAICWLLSLIWMADLFRNNIHFLKRMQLLLLLGKTVVDWNLDRNQELWNIVPTEICRCCWNITTYMYKWKIHNKKNETIFFVCKFSGLIFNFYVYVKVWSKHSCICGIPYFNLNGIDVFSVSMGVLISKCL